MSGTNATPILCVSLFILFAARGAASDSILADAIEREQWQVVNKQIDVPEQLQAAQPDGMTPLHWAVYHGNLEVTKRLLTAGVESDALTQYGVSPLSIACIHGNASIVGLLIAEGVEVDRMSNGGETPLLIASRQGNADVIRALVTAGANVNGTERKGQTPLMWAAAEGNGEAIGALLDGGANVDHTLNSGFNAFMFAAREGRIDAVRRLLAAGVDVNSVMTHEKSQGRAPRVGTSALLLAVESGHFELALFLIEKGADPNDQRSGFAPLHALTWVRKPASGDGIDGDPSPRGSGNVTSLDFARRILIAGANVNLALERGSTGKAQLNMKGAPPFLLASKTADLPLLRLLLEFGADPLLPNADGCTPILAAAGVGTVAVGEEPGTESEVLETIEFLLAQGAEINTVDANQETVMHGAAYRSYPKEVELLGRRGAVPSVWNHKNKHNWTPMKIAEGSRPGSVKPSPEVIAALKAILESAP